MTDEVYCKSCATLIKGSPFAIKNKMCDSCIGERVADMRSNYE